MKLKKIINFLEEKYPLKDAFEGDYIGLQIEGKENIETIIVTLDVNLDVINQAIENDVDLIITHHPFFFGDKDVLIKNNPFLKAKYDLIKSKNINLYALHTNIDFSVEGITKKQAQKLNMENINFSKNKEILFGKLKKEYDSIDELIDFIKTSLKVDHVRTNLTILENKQNVAICSGANGDQLFNSEIIGNIFIVGEMKWHHWVFANEMGISVIEIGHFSESIVKELLSDLLIENLNLKVIESVEENGFWQV